MSNYSLFTDDAGLTRSLLVQEPDGAVRLAKRAEILSVARELVSVDELRGQKLDSPSKVKNFLRLRLTGLGHEVCGVFFLDSSNQLIQYREPFRGTVGQATVYPREIVKLSLQFDATSVILVHNHPSGNAEASAADIQLTRTVGSFVLACLKYPNVWKGVPHKLSDLSHELRRGPTTEVDGGELGLLKRLIVMSINVACQGIPYAPLLLVRPVLTF
ncbi:DNA repair proteins [Cupriavidus gilardii J11]|uniref:DNA repair proteins n=1 Tax=Cupriavidus gilardii J11 TaxID=936133 RepID=A0A562BWZ8_9BURK|nr:JAB domain-containing protein [Cupriavidus gilardii]TWG89213.1 DNA repair proteins [Cupriavidus gilardii J11]